MRPSLGARALMAFAGGLVLAGFLSLTVTPAALGLGVLVFLVHTRRAFAEHVEATEVRLERSVVDRVVHEGQTFEVELDATGTRLPAALELRLVDQLPRELATPEAGPSPEVPGPFEGAYMVHARTKGEHRFTHALAVFTDARGLWHHETTVPAETHVSILPPREALESGRRLAKEQPLDATTQKALGTMIRELEFDQLRAYQPGDTMRTIDWKRFSKLDEMITKAWEKEGESEVLILVDAGRTMRARQAPGELTKLDHAASLALSIAESAIEHNYPVGLIAFDELRVVERISPTRARTLPDRLAERLSELPPRVVAKRRLDVGLPGDAEADEQELDFLAKLASLTDPTRPNTATGSHAEEGAQASPDEERSHVGQRHREQRRGSTSREIGLRRAIGHLLQQAGKDKLFVLVFTDLERVPDETLKAIAQLTERGHRVTAGILPGSSFLSPPEPPIRARDLENAYKELETRQRAARILEARDVATLELGATSTAADVTATSQTDDRDRRRRGGGVRGR